MKRKDKSAKGSFRILRITAFCIFTVSFFYVIYTQGLAFLKRSEYLKVRQILYDQGSEFIKSSKLAGLKNKNILDIDLSSVQNHLQRQYPEISQLQIYRRFPNQLLVIARKRVAIAKANIKNRDIILDEDGVILTSAGNRLELPTIYGKNLSKASVTPGTMVQGPDIRCALKVIKDFQDHKGLNDYQMTKINVDNLSQVYFFILKEDKGNAAANVIESIKDNKVLDFKKLAVNEELKIIIDRDNIPHKMNILEVVLSQAKPEFADVQYVDLRFKEPILGKKDPQK